MNIKLFLFLSVIFVGCGADISTIDDQICGGYDTIVLEVGEAHDRVVFVSPNKRDTLEVAKMKGTYFGNKDGYHIPNYGPTCACRPKLCAKTYFANNHK